MDGHFNDAIQFLISLYRTANNLFSVVEWGTTIKYKFDRLGMCQFCITLSQYFCRLWQVIFTVGMIASKISLHFAMPRKML